MFKQRSFWHIGALALAAGIACAQQVGGEKLRPFWSAATERRVDVVHIGDSTQLYGGHGWDEGWSRGLNDRFGLYATGIHAAGENAGNGAGVGWGSNTFSTRSTGQYQYTGAPSDLDATCQPLFTPVGYLYVPSGSSASSIYNSGMVLEAASPLGVSGPLRFHYRYGRFIGAATGSFRPVVRSEVAPFSNLSTPVNIATSGGPGLAAGFIDVPAAARTSAVGFHWTQAGGPAISGPFFGSWMRIERTDRTVGAALSTLYGVGSMSMRDAAASLMAVDDATLASFFSMLRSMQPAPARILIRVSFGVNDRNETLVSVGPGAVLPGNSAAAFEDNTRALITRLDQFWLNQGWDPAELHFAIAVSPPISAPDDPQLISYRERAEVIAANEPRTATVRFDQLTSFAQMQSQSWYNATFDTIHLSQAGFTALSDMEINALYSGASTMRMDWQTIDTGGTTLSSAGSLALSGTIGQADAGRNALDSVLWCGGFWSSETSEFICPADFNRDGGVDGSDVGAFFAEWEAGWSSADVNGDGGVDGGDVDAFFAVWEAGGC